MQHSFSSVDSSFNSPPQASSLSLNDRKRKKLISELQNGRRAATELHHHHFFAARDRVSAKELQVSAAELSSRIMSSFISCLTDMADHQGKEQEGKRMPSTSRNEKKQRGGSKKKRKINSISPRDPESIAKRKQTKVVESSDLSDDGHAWRKYGHKRIKSSPHPRDYYKCTHWEDEHCQATKWVQKVSDQPSIYRTTYDKEHTCRSSFGASHLTISTGHGFSSLVDESADSCTYLSFGGKSNHPSITTGAVSVDCQQNEYSVLQPNSLCFSAPPPPPSSSLMMLQDIEDLNNNGSFQQTTIGSAKNQETVTSEEDTIDLMQIVEMPTNPYDDLNEILFSSDHIISDLPSVAPINMSDQDQYYVGDARSSVEEAFFFPTTSNCNYMTMQDDTMGYDHAFDTTVMDMYLGDVF